MDAISFRITLDSYIDTKKTFRFFACFLSSLWLIIINIEWNGQLAEAQRRISHRSSTKSYATGLNKMWKSKILNCLVCCGDPDFYHRISPKTDFYIIHLLTFALVCCQLPDSWWFMNILWTRFGSHRNCYELIKNGCHFKNCTFPTCSFPLSFVLRAS